MDGIRSLIIQDIPQARKLSDAEGWNQTDKDWQLLVTTPGNVCLAFTSGDKIIATATAMNYNNDLAWIGMVLVNREHRGKGLSKLLITALLDKMKSCRSFKLDATPAGQPVYEKFGFKNEGIVLRMTSDALVPDWVQPESYLSAERIAVNNISEIIEYERQVTGVSRKALIEYLINEYSQDAFLIKTGGKVKGFGLGREGARFQQIGPLVAETIKDAKVILIEIFTNHVGKPVVLDVPADKHILIEWLLTVGFKKQRHFVRMHLDEESLPSISKKMFLISGPEFG